MSIVFVRCTDNILPVDIESIRERCPHVLLRFLGAIDGFHSPKTDEEGNLTFAKDYDLTRLQLAACMHFLRTGICMSPVESIWETFEYFGGCEAFDEYLRAREEENQQRVTNPLNPSEDIECAYTWSVHNRGWEGEEGWNCVSRVDEASIVFWYRKENSLI